METYLICILFLYDYLNFSKLALSQFLQYTDDITYNLNAMTWSDFFGDYSMRYAWIYAAHCTRTAHWSVGIRISKSIARKHYYMLHKFTLQSVAQCAWVKCNRGEYVWRILRGAHSSLPSLPLKLYCNKTKTYVLLCVDNYVNNCDGYTNQITDFFSLFFFFVL